MKYTFEMEDEQVVAIIVSELQEAHRLNVVMYNDEGGFPIEPDFELLKALEVILKYYMIPSEFEQWMEEVYNGSE